MRVLIGVDGSPASLAAVRMAGSLLSAATDQVTLYYSPPEIRIPAGASPSLVERAKAAVVESVFNDARGGLPGPLQTAAATLTGERPPRQGLLLAADEIGAELIVAGARGTGGMQEWLLGSVSKAVVYGAKVPVLVVRGDGDLRPAPRVLLAYDASQPSRQAAAFLNRFTWPAGSSACVMAVIEAMSVGKPPEWLAKQARDPEAAEIAAAFAAAHNQERAARQAELEQVRSTLPAALQPVEIVVAEGQAAERIIETAAARQSHLIVVGARGHSGWERLLLGSTTEKVLAYTGSSVLVTHARARP